MGIDYSFAHAACLLTQLPRDSRIARLEDPNNAWSVEAYLIRRLEYDFRLFAWAMGGGNGDEPEPLAAPGDAARKADEMQAIKANMEFVKGVLDG